MRITLKFIFILLVLWCEVAVAQQVELITPDSIEVSHASSLVRLNPGVLPSGDTLHQPKFIVCAFGGSREGAKDNIVWMQSSNDEGKTWGDFKIITSENHYTATDSMARDPLLFQLANKQLVLLYRVQDREGSGSKGGPVKAYYRKSEDGGNTWSNENMVAFERSEDSTFRNFTSISKPIFFNDSLYFPSYYRILGNPNPHFYLLVSNPECTEWHYRDYSDLLKDISGAEYTEPCGFEEEGELTVLFRNNLGLTHKIKSKDGISWGAVMTESVPNAGTKQERISEGFSTYSEANNANSLIRNTLNIRHWNQDDSGFIFLRHINDTSTLQFSYPSLLATSDAFYVTYSHLWTEIENGFNRTKGRIIFTKVDKSSLSEHNGIKWIYRVPTLSATDLVDYSDSFVYTVNREGHIIGIGLRDSTILHVRTYDTLVNRFADFQYEENKLYLISGLNNGPHYYVYAEDGNLLQASKLAKPPLTIRYKNARLFILTNDRKSFYTNLGVGDSVRTQIDLTGTLKVRQFEIVNDSQLVIAGMGGELGILTLPSLQWTEIHDKMNAIINLIGIKGNALIYSENDTVIMLDLADFSILASQYFPFLGDTKSSGFVELSEGNFAFSNANHVYNFDFETKMFTPRISSGGYFQITGLARNLQDSSLIVVNSFGQFSGLPNVYHDILYTRSHKSDPSDLFLYPNPAKNRVCLSKQFENSRTTAVHLVTGRQVAVKRIDNDCFDISNLENGSYVFIIETPNGSYSKKLIITK